MSSSRPLRVKRPPEGGDGSGPRRSGSNRGENPGPKRTGSNRDNNPGSRSSGDGPTRGVTRNRSLPRKMSSDVNEETPKRRQPRKEPSGRGVNRVRSGGLGGVLKGRRAPSERTSSGGNVTSGRTGSRANPPESPISGTPSGRKGRKVATPVAGTIRPPVERSRGSARTNDARTRSRSADLSRKVSSRRSTEEAPVPNRKGRRAASGGNVMPKPAAPVGSPGAAKRKVRRAVPEKRGIAPSKSLPSEQIRRVERIRQGQKQNAGFYRAPSRRKQEESSSSEEESDEESSSEESSSSESSIEPTESHRGGDFNDDDYDSDVDIIQPPRNEEQQDDLHYSGNFDFSDDDDISFGPPPNIGGRVVYPGGIVVEDASDSECEWEHRQPSRNRKPDFRNGDDWLQPISASYGSMKRSSSENTPSTTESSTKKSSQRSASGSEHKSTSKRSGNKKPAANAGRGGGSSGKVRRANPNGQSPMRGSNDPRGDPNHRNRTKSNPGMRSRSRSNERPLFDEKRGGPSHQRQTRGDSSNQRPRGGRQSPVRSHSDEDVLVEDGHRVKRKQARPGRRGTGGHARGQY